MSAGDWPQLVLVDVVLGCAVCATETVVERIDGEEIGRPLCERCGRVVDVHLAGGAAA